MPPFSSPKTKVNDHIKTAHYFQILYQREWSLGARVKTLLIKTLVICLNTVQKDYKLLKKITLTVWTEMEYEIIVSQ